MDVRTGRRVANLPSLPPALLRWPRPRQQLLHASRTAHEPHQVGRADPGDPPAKELVARWNAAQPKDIPLDSVGIENRGLAPKKAH
jgi:hypothetical protein